MSKSEFPYYYARFVELVLDDLQTGTTRNKTYYEKEAKEFGILDKNLVKELTELAITKRARTTALDANSTIAEKYHSLVLLYKSQVNLSHRTSQSVLLQQYSTPAPISYLAGVFCGAGTGTSVFEPSAGNGLLCLAARPEYTTVNEIDEVRLANLSTQGFQEIASKDASMPFVGLEKKFESVLTNPPFGLLDQANDFDSYGIKTLEHSMAIHALNCMMDNGRASIIVGGHANYDELGRIRRGNNRIFLNYLYKHYYVVDVINISGKQLYSRQGTGIDVRLILISGRKEQPEGHAPLFDEQREKPVTDFDTLYNRVIAAFQLSKRLYEMTKQEYIDLQRKITSLIPARNGDESSRLHSYEKQHREIITTYFNSGYVIDISIRSDYPDMQLTHPQKKAQMKTDEDDFDEQARKLLEQMKGGLNQAPALCALPKMDLYLLDFQDTDDPSKKYQSYLAAYSQEKAKRKAYDVVIEMSKNEPPIRLVVTSVKKWLAPYQLNGLGAPYLPTSQGCIVLDTVVPDSMSYEAHQALEKVTEAVGGDLDEFVRNRLGYGTKLELCHALAAEQIDAVALAIYNIEARRLGGNGQGMIVGDQTGIGKGRVAAALIRYAIKRGLKPVFLTEKANLFTDIYRDLKAIGGASYVPFIFNAHDLKSDILDEEGEVLYSAPDKHVQDAIFKQGELPSVYDFVVATYTQFNSITRALKRDFLEMLAFKNVLVFDEAHNASGKGNTGSFFVNKIVPESEGILFLSATYAKRPENMPVYALKTVLQEANLSHENLVGAIDRGGIVLQEVIASELVKEGQMVRRERSSEGVVVNYITLSELEQDHREIADNITEILRDIIQFQRDFISPEVGKLDKELARQQESAQLREGTQKAGVDHLPYFSKVFQVIHQMLFSIKAEAVADLAIQHLREGKKPVIAFSSTMGSFVENEDEEKVNEGDIISGDFSQVLMRGLKGINRYSIVSADGTHQKEEFNIATLGPKAVREYERIEANIQNISTGISISPIDVMIDRIRKAGFSVVEVTGRKYRLDLFEADEQTINGLGQMPTPEDDPFNPIQRKINAAIKNSSVKLLARVLKRKRIVTNEAFRLFNNNQIDVLLINQSGSTGASAHAIPTPNVPSDQVKQRVMLVLQAELDITTEVQKRGRINRTGQIFKPIYDYVSSAIPAEQRLMMMLQSKLKSLDANTTSNQKQSKNILDVPDFLNKYGDSVVAEYLFDNPEVDAMLDHPLGVSNTDAALRVSGRVAVLSTKMQDEFYTHVIQAYNDRIAYLIETGEYNLELERMDLQTTTLEQWPAIVGKGGTSVFGSDSIMEKVEANVLRKPLTVSELEKQINDNLAGRTPQEVQEQLKIAFQNSPSKHLEEIARLEQKFHEALQDVEHLPKLIRVKETQGQKAYDELYLEKKKSIEIQREESIEKVFRQRKGLEHYMNKILDFFYIGKQLYFAQEGTKSSEVELSPAVFLGFDIDLKKENPFILSNMKLRFAIGNSMRYILIPASKQTEVLFQISKNEMDSPSLTLAQFWSEAIKNKMNNREKRFIVTGNLLQGLGLYRGKLINYTTKDGAEKKGILMPSDWNGDIDQTITIPATQAEHFILELSEGKQITFDSTISIFRQNGRFKIITPLSKSKSGGLYLNNELLKLIDGNNFNKVSNSMVGLFDTDKLPSVLSVLERAYSASIWVSKKEYLELRKKYPNPRVQSSFPTLELLPQTHSEQDADDLELEAMALVLLQSQELEKMKRNSKN